MNLQDNDFELFQLPRRQQLDLAELDQRWKTLQRQVHPDRFVAQGAAAQRVAMQWSVRINEAYQRLKDPLKRAAYLCELGGVPVEAHSNTAMPADFLMQQMEWREALDDAEDAGALQALACEVQQASSDALQEVTAAIDTQQDMLAAAALVRRMMFIQKFAQEVRQRQLQQQLQQS
ncbi:Fe-S protein assembly co-chaperone HscB [Brachymonas denitrificans]|uniref:Co-chaperone protein HscB homolog n=1 Tax=Brachymonas denitrificans DSM 15123 TaxID=1121117 RepID=A0A1H8I0Q2_9BURK|nr:Fe-S protein assembly co-chaperone HscB [Brachymonas denitrificans]SEN62083.1 molecular chaperone HscB [Brachymonas denitrificans DSM 15123]